MTMHPTVAAYLRNLLSLDERITSVSFVVQHSTTDDERNGLVVAIEHPGAYGVVRFCNGLVWGDRGVAGINSLYAADEIGDASIPLWEELDGACTDDAVNVLRSLPEVCDDGDAWTLYRDEVRAA
jgi:hypothetical protein